MPLRYIILGCGASSGVPRIGNDWGKCDPANSRNRRTRPSIIVESSTTRILVDTSPDMRQQFLAADIDHVDAILWTHDHADHTHGIDDVRQIFHKRRATVPGYAHPKIMELLQARFSYAFYGRNGYPPIIQGEALDAPIRIGDIDVNFVNQPHGSIYSTGFRFTNGHSSIGYSTDCSELTPDMLRLFRHVGVWIIDTLRETAHPTHMHLAQALDALAAVEPGMGILTHMDQSLDYERLRSVLPRGVTPAYDLMSAWV